MSNVSCMCNNEHVDKQQYVILFVFCEKYIFFNVTKVVRLFCMDAFLSVLFRVFIVHKMAFYSETWELGTPKGL